MLSTSVEVLLRIPKAQNVVHAGSRYLQNKDSDIAKDGEMSPCHPRDEGAVWSAESRAAYTGRR